MLNEQLIRQIDECLEEVEALVPLLQLVVKLPLFHKEKHESLGDGEKFVLLAEELNPKLSAAPDRLDALAYKLPLTARQCADFFPDTKEDCDRVLALEFKPREFSANTVENLRAASNYLERIRQVVSAPLETSEGEIPTPSPHSDQSPTAISSNATSRASEIRSSSPPQSRPDPEVAKRRAIVARYPKRSARDLCKRFDLENVPLIDGWSEEFNVTSWLAAYKQPTLRTRIDALISKDKRSLTGLTRSG